MTPQQGGFKMNWTSSAFCVATLVALAACGNLPVSNAQYSVGYAPGEVVPNNAVPTLVMGNPFSIPQPEFAAAVVDAMQGNTSDPATFVASNNSSGVYRVIMLFGSGTFTGEALCAQPPRAHGMSGTGPSASLPLAATLCRGDSFLAYAHGTVDGSGGPSSPAFRRGVGQFTRLLFPVQNPERCVNC